MGKITKYFGQTIFSQIFSLIPLKEIISIISNGGYDKYTKKFNSIDHLITLLYGVLKGFDSLREITNDLSINEKRLKKSGLSKAPSRSTISDANNRRSASFFGNVYSMLYGLYANFLSNISDSGSQKWLRLLHVIDSTTITLFSSILKGAGRNPISGKKKGGIKSQIWVTLIANLLMTVVQRKAEAKSCSGKKYFSNIMTITRAMMLYYINLYKLLADPKQSATMFLRMPHN